MYFNELIKMNNTKFYIIVFLISIYILIVFSWMKEYEVKLDKLETCIETHQKLNRNETQIICGRIVK